MGHTNPYTMKLFKILLFLLCTFSVASVSAQPPVKERLFVLDTNSIATDIEYFSPDEYDAPLDSAMTRYYVVDTKPSMKTDSVKHYELFTDRTSSVPRLVLHDPAPMKFLDLPSVLPVGLEYLIRVKRDDEGKDVLFPEHVKKGSKPIKPGNVIRFTK